MTPRLDAADVPTPTLNAMSSIQPESQAVGNFIEWLSERGMFIAHYPPGSDDRPFPVYKSTEQMLADYFGIDLVAAEKERCAILAAHRATVGAR